jgi:segregation and condensation protein B
MLEGDRKNQLLAILFATREPVTPGELSQLFEDCDSRQIDAVAQELIDEFNRLQGAVEIRRVAGGFRMTTRPEHHEIIGAYLKTRPSAKLSQAALETLAAIAYRQPITLPEIMEIRGVKGTSTIKTLLEKKLIETRGRKKVVGRPILYGTTRQFLMHFGLQDLSELPTLEEFEEILAQSEAGS